MYSSFRHRISPTLLHRKVVTYGFAASKKAAESQRPVRRQFGTLLTSSQGSVHLRQRHASQIPAALRNLHVRAISYSSIPRFVARAFRVPIAGAALCAGGFYYANYKFEELRGKATAWISSVQGVAADFIDSASDGIKSVSSRVSAVQLSDIETPQFLKDLFASVKNGDKSTAWISSVQGVAADFIDSASDGIKSVSSRVSAVQLPDKETPQTLEDLFESVENGDKSTAWISSVQGIAANFIDSASEGIKSVPSRVPAVQLPDIQTPQFLRDLFASVENDEKSREENSQGESSNRRSPEVTRCDIGDERET